MPYIIGISGGSGSGKTAFINKLKSSFHSKDLGLISMDHYYFPRKFQKTDANGIINFDIPGAIDHRAFLEDLMKLEAGITVRREEYTFNNNQKEAELIIIEPAKVYLVEGLFIYHDEEIKNKLDLKILMHARDDIKIIRRIQRDKEERNYPLEDVLYRYQFHVTPSYEQYILPYMDEIDIIINNTRSFENALAVISAFLREKISFV